MLLGDGGIDGALPFLDSALNNLNHKQGMNAARLLTQIATAGQAARSRMAGLDVNINLGNAVEFAFSADHAVGKQLGRAMLTE